MKTIHLKPFFLLSLLIILFATGCHKQSQKCLALPVALVLPEINFKVVDKTTGNDLFFGSHAIYKTSQLKAAQLTSGFADSTVLFTDSLHQFFILRLMHSNAVDTVTLKVAGLSQDNLVFKVSEVSGGGPCAVYEPVVSQVLYNGVSVYTAANGPAVVSLIK